MSAGVDCQETTTYCITYQSRLRLFSRAQPVPEAEAREQGVQGRVLAAVDAAVRRGAVAHVVRPGPWGGRQGDRQARGREVLARLGEEGARACHVAWLSKPGGRYVVDCWASCWWLRCWCIWRLCRCFGTMSSVSVSGWCCWWGFFMDTAPAEDDTTTNVPFPTNHPLPSFRLAQPFPTTAPPPYR